MDIECMAGGIMKRAVDSDTAMRYTEALVYYKEGLQVIAEKIDAENDKGKKECLRGKEKEYMNRVNTIKDLIQELKQQGDYGETVHIKENSTGHGYKTLFGRFLDDKVEYVVIEDPYIRTFHQCQNFLWLCELLVKSCCNLNRIQLITNTDQKSEANQRDWLYNIQTDMQKYGIQVTIGYTNSASKKIILSSGWIIQISRGLNIYKPLNNKFCLGTYDPDLRQCHETKINIIHSNDLEKSIVRTHITAPGRGDRQSRPLANTREPPSQPLGAFRNPQSRSLATRRGPLVATNLKKKFPNPFL